MRPILSDAASLAAAHSTHVRSRVDGNVNATGSRSAHSRDSNFTSIVYESRTYTAVISRIADEMLLAIAGPLIPAEGEHKEAMANGGLLPTEDSVNGHTQHSSASEEGEATERNGVLLENRAGAGANQASRADPAILEALQSISQDLAQYLRQQLRSMRCPEDF